MGPFELQVESAFQRRAIGMPDWTKYDPDTDTMGRTDVPGYVSQQHPGLGYVGRAKNFVVVHVPSGKKLAPASSGPECQAIINALGPLTSWSVSADKLPSRVLKAIRDVVLDVKVNQFGYDKSKVSFQP